MSLKVIHSPEEWRTGFGGGPTRAVATIGNFDGAHLGHQKILRRVAERAQRDRSLASVVTFEPHPVKVLRPGETLALLATLEQRLAAFEKMGIEAALVLRFDRALADLSPNEFLLRILVGTMRARAILVGGNFRFGRDQAGDVHLLAELGNQLGFEVEIISSVVVRGNTVSSTAIRQAVRDGKMSRAGRFLGRPYALAGGIRAGSSLGRKLVVPTLNLETQQELLPKFGVYASETRVADRLYRSVTNVGLRPTFDGRQTTVESHLFDFTEELARGPMEVRFWRHLRDELRFSGPEELRAQVLRDIARARSFFRRLDRFRRAPRPAPAEST